MWVGGIDWFAKLNEAIRLAGASNCGKCAENSSF